LKSGKIFLIILGSVALLIIILAFTSAPFWIRYNMGTAKAGITGIPDYVVVLGGGGIPGKSGLMRTYYGAKAAAEFPSAKIIVALPGDTADSTSSVMGMRKELILRGVAPERIMLEDSGANTRAEALLVKELIHNNDTSILDPRPPHLLLITSPEHLYRAVLVFRKAGFERVDGLPAFESSLESDFSFSARRLGGRVWIPDVGESQTLRYRFWNYIKYEFDIIREWVAIAYYWIMGWI